MTDNVITIGTDPELDRSNTCYWSGIITKIHDSKTTRDGNPKVRFLVNNGHANLWCGLVGEDATTFINTANIGNTVSVAGKLFLEKYNVNGERRSKWFLRASLATVVKA